MKVKKLNECTWGEKVSIELMITKILDRNNSMMWLYAGDKNKDIKIIFTPGNTEVNEGDVINFTGHYSEPFKPDSYEKVKEFDIKDFVPTVNRPIEDIIGELNEISNEEFKSKEVIALNNYFFQNDHFMSKFIDAIGGVYNHHNYLGGLAEHTLGVMKLARTLAYNYDVRYKEIAILGAKIHDIGKVYEMSYDGPFRYTNTGSLQGHIVMGVTMVEKAFIENPDLYTDEFKDRIKAIIVQHHGKLEYGSPVAPRTVEAFIVHYADYVDASLNKIGIIGKDVASGEWSKFDKRIEGRILY